MLLPIQNYGIGNFEERPVLGRVFFVFLQLIVEAIATEFYIGTQLCFYGMWYLVKYEVPMSHSGAICPRVYGKYHSVKTLVLKFNLHSPF